MRRWACVSWTGLPPSPTGRTNTGAKSKSCRRLYWRKFFYVFTCEYCFIHYVTPFFLFITGFTLMFGQSTLTRRALTSASAI